MDTAPAATAAARSIIPLTIRSSNRIVSGPVARQIIRRSNLNHRHEFLHRRRRFLEGSVLVRREFDLDDLLEALCAQLARNTDKEIAHAVLALQEHRAGNDLVFVEQDGL